MIAKSASFGAVCLLSSLLLSQAVAEQPSALSPTRIRDAFAATHQGFSSDEVLIQPDLRDAFLKSLYSGEELSVDREREALLALLRLRKAGKLEVPTTRRGQAANASVQAVAEIAARVVTDRHRVTSDRMLADRELRDEFVKEAAKLSKGLGESELSKAVLSLRKKRALRPELVLQVATWNRTLTTHSLSELQSLLVADGVSTGPGVYLFRSRDEYLYIGEADNLSRRLNEHVGQSDRLSLAKYLSGPQANEVTVELHIFPDDSPAAKTTVRRAYESELIRSRNPKFNVRP